MPSLPFNSHYPSLLLMTIFCFFILAGCAVSQSNVKNSYHCTLTKLTLCGKDTNASCTEIPASDFIEQPHTVFDPKRLTALSYEGKKQIEKSTIHLWKELNNTIFMTGYGVKAEDDATVWSGTIRGDNRELTVSAFSVDYNYTLLGSCQVR